MPGMRYGLVFATLAWAAVVEAQTGFLDQTITLKGESYRYQVYVPAEYATKPMWPMIVALHGGGRQGTDGLQPTAIPLAQRIREDRAALPAIVLFPQARPNTRFMYPEMQDLVMAELRQTIARYHVDTMRIYLHGHSMGCEGAYRIAYRWPKVFAALALSAGQVQIPSPPYPQSDVDIDRRANAFAAAADPFAALAERIKGIPIWLVHSDSDEAMPVEQSRQLVAALRRVGADLHYTEYQGLKHDDAPKRAWADTAYVSWVFAQRRH
jgi:predicted peptidase